MGIRAAQFQENSWFEILVCDNYIISSKWTYGQTSKYIISLKQLNLNKSQHNNYTQMTRI